MEGGLKKKKTLHKQFNLLQTRSSRNFLYDIVSHKWSQNSFDVNPFLPGVHSKNIQYILLSMYNV